MFSGSVRRVNTDGSRNVFCFECREFISRVPGAAGFNTALCVVCQAKRNGITLPAQIVAQLRSDSLGVIYSDQTYDPILEKHIDTVDDAIVAAATPNRFMKVIGTVRRIAKSLIPVSTDVTQVSSVKLAKSKKRTRIFDGPIDE